MPWGPASRVESAEGIRRGTQALALLALVVLAGLIVWDSSTDGWLRGAGLLGLAWLGWWWTESGGRPRLVVAGEAAGAGSLLLAAMAAGNPALMLGVVYAGVAVGAADARRRVAVTRLVAFAAVYLLAAAVIHPAGASGLTVAAVTAVVPGLPIAAGLVRLWREAVRGRQRSARIAARLQEAAASLGAAPTAATILAAGCRGAVGLIALSPDAEGTLVTGSAELVARLGAVRESGAGMRAVPVPETASPLLRERLRRGGAIPAADAGTWAELSRLLQLPATSRHVLLVPVAGDGDPWATWAVASAVPLPADVAAAWRILAGDLARGLAGVRVSERLGRSEARFRALVESASDLVVAVDADGRLVYHSPSVPEFLGRPVDLDHPPDWRQLVHPDDVAAVRASVATAHRVSGSGLPVDGRLLARDGGWRWFEIVPSNLLGDPRAGVMVLAMRDISERVALEDQLRHDALHDPLTGIANRALLRDRLEHALAALERVRRTLVLLLLDLDHFKDVNDTFGHEAGDQVLLETTWRIRRCLRSSDTFARLGGDEFAILIEDGEGPETGALLAVRILQALRRPVRVNATIRVTAAASVGITATSDRAVDARELLRECDLALYTAKAEGRGRYAMYGPPLAGGIEPRARLRAVRAAAPLARSNAG